MPTASPRPASPTSEPSRPRKSRTARVAAAGAALAVAALSAVPLLAKHPSNAGPEDPPIKFPQPTPKPLSPQEALQTFKLPPGFKIEVAAAEPDVEDPIAISFDSSGKMWVVEFRGYMHDLEGGGEDQPTCRIKILEDTNGDGHFKTSSIFLDNLILPRAVLPTRGGALVAEPPTLAFYRNDDGHAGEKTVIANDYGVKGGQPEHMANGLYPALDNWIYNAAHSYRYRFSHGKWVSEPTPARGQWGVSQDDWGRMYYCSNSDLGRADPLPAHYFTRNPFYKATASQNVEIVPDQHVWPSHPTPGVNRGYSPNELRSDGTLQNATAACGNTNYRGGLFGPEFEDNYFVCEPSANLIQRYRLSENAGRISAKNAYDKMDFLTSTDERFRPVNLCDGPDGALYVVDLYRGVLQHTAFLTNYLIKNIHERNLEMPIHNGRIYRVVPAGKDPKPVKLPKEPTELVEFLTHPNGWVRDMAQRILVEKHDDDTVPPLEKMAASGASPVSRVHALWTLDGMGKLDAQVSLKALHDPDPHVRITAVRLCEPLLLPTTRAQSLPELLKLVGDADPGVQLQLGMTLAEVPDPAAEEALVKLVTTTAANVDMMRDAAISGLRGRELEFADRLLGSPSWSANASAATGPADRAQTLSALAQCVMSEHRSARVKKLLQLTAEEHDGSWRQLALLRGMVPPNAARKAAPKPAPKTKPATQPSPTAAGSQAGGSRKRGSSNASKNTAPDAPKFASYGSNESSKGFKDFAKESTKDPNKDGSKSSSKAGGKSTTKATDQGIKDPDHEAAPAAPPSGPPIKLIYLDAEPEAMSKLLASPTPQVRDLAKQVDARLAWPGKPGVPPPPKIIPLTDAQQAQFDHGKVVFSQTCAACHQPTGLGQEGLAPPLVDSEWVLGPDHRLVRIVLQGVSGPINVEGVQYRLEMPPLNKLPDQDIADILTYVRREWEHNAAPVTVDTVKQVRDDVKNRSDPWTADELIKSK